jgi:hypothetical protein
MYPVHKASLSLIMVLLFLSGLMTLTYFANVSSSIASLFANPLDGSLLQPAMLQGLLAGLIFLFGVILISYIPEQWWFAGHSFTESRWFAAAILLLFVTPFALGGFWFSSGAWGISDWDYYFSYHESLRRMILSYQTIPVWNPYICGGTATVGDPEFPVFAPTFLLELAFGVPVGLRLAIYFATATGAVGMLFLAKRLRLSLHAALLAAIGVAFSSVNLLEIVEGHPNIFAAMWLPWVFWSWLGAYQQQNRKNVRRSCLVLGVFLALMFFQGGIYLLMYTSLALVALIFVAPRRWHALKISLSGALWSLGFAALKLIPVLWWLSQFPDKAYASSTYTLPWLHIILLGRYLHGGENIIPAQGGGWHEYGSYVGPVILALAVVGLAAAWRRRVVRVLALGVIATILLSSAGPLLKPVFDQVAFLPRSNISRIVLLSVIGLSLLAGFGLDSLRSRRTGALALGLLGLVALDLMSLAYPLSEQAFVLPAVVPTVSPAPAPVAYTLNTHTVRSGGVDYTRSYANILAGWGTQSYCSVLGAEPAIRPFEQDGKEYLSTTDPQGTVRLLAWSPSHLHVEANVQPGSQVVVNSNYTPGWYVNDQPAVEIAGRLAAVAPGSQNILRYHYQAPGWYLGLTISGLTLLSAVWSLWSVWPKAPRSQPAAQTGKTK